MAAPDLQVALWSVRPPDLMQVAAKFGKRQLRESANGSGMSGVIQKHSAATGEFWAVLRAESPAYLAVLRGKLRERCYEVQEVQPGAVPDALLRQLERKPVEVLPSADEIHSRGSSGARDRGEIAPTADEEDRLTLGSALDDAAAQATLAARQLRRAEEALEKAERAAKEAERAAKEARAEARAEAKAEREKGELAAKEEREKGERERAALAQAAKEEREKVDRERASERAALLAAEVRAARAEAMLARRSCAIV